MYLSRVACAGYRLWKPNAAGVDRRDHSGGGVVCGGRISGLGDGPVLLEMDVQTWDFPRGLSDVTFFSARCAWMRKHAWI
ncbi:hypothetical protein AcV7_003905 [Taiwanofungus camphoratus]|nr:hypothetical protein AcV7_003905 [Antrodia cinnamomea]